MQTMIQIWHYINHDADLQYTILYTLETNKEQMLFFAHASLFLKTLYPLTSTPCN